MTGVQTCALPIFDIQILITPKKVLVKDGKLAGLECLRNKLGDFDESGRQRPVPIEGSEFSLEFDTVIVAISEDSGVDAIGPAKQSHIDITGNNTIKVDRMTLQTTRDGVFAAGDVVRGPNTVVDAIADGKRAARMIDRYVRGLELAEVSAPILPRVYVPPVSEDLEDLLSVDRVETPRAPADWRKRNFSEVEVSLSIDEAHCEARRCLRCDLEFTKRQAPGSEEEGQSEALVTGGKQV